MTTDRVALVTGGAGALGRAIAMRLATDGATVVVVDVGECRASRAAEQLSGEIGARVHGWEGDVASDAANRLVKDRVRDEFGRLDQFVKNAVVAHRSESLVVEKRLARDPQTQALLADRDRVGGAVSICRVDLVLQPVVGQPTGLR